MKTAEEIRNQIDFLNRVFVRELKVIIKEKMHEKLDCSSEKYDLKIRERQIQTLEWVLGDSK